MSPKRQKDKKIPRYQREQGTRDVVVARKRLIAFSLSKHIKGEGQDIDEWSTLGLLQRLMVRMKYVGQHSVHEVKQLKYIKEYHKVSFPENSQFTHPKHIPQTVVWAVMHITDSSKEVAVGYIEDDIFYIVFLDKDHLFWPVKLKNT